MPQKSDNLTLVDNTTPVLLGRCASYPSGLRTLHDSPPRLPHPFAFGLNDFFAGRADRAIALPDGDAPRASIRGKKQAVAATTCQSGMRIQSKRGQVVRD